MQFWLSFNNGAESLQLPVPPSVYDIVTGTNVDVENIVKFGELAVIGRRKLASIELASFFPAQEYNFVQYRGFPTPYECVRMIDDWKQSGKPIRLIITGTTVNLPMIIEEFRYGERDGTRDVYFVLRLKEYRFIGGEQDAGSDKRPIEHETPKEYIVKDGDTLWDISKKVYGTGDRWREIASKNSIANERQLQVGSRLAV